MGERYVRNVQARGSNPLISTIIVDGNNGMTTRAANIERKTRETEISLKLNLDSTDPSTVDTGIPFINHMLDLMATHGFMQLVLKGRGDTEIDDHHTVEDLGICLGLALKQALGKKRGDKPVWGSDRSHG